MFLKKISVVIPTYNRAKLLKECLTSLCKQEYKNFEVIVVDDGSKDQTKEIVDSFKKNLDIKYIFQENKGPACARNLGIKMASGDIVAFIDDDCIASRQWLKAINEAFDGQIGGVEGKTIPKHALTPFSHCVINLYGGRYPTCNIAYKKAILNKIYFDESFPACYHFREDSDLAFTIIENGYTIKFASEALVYHLFVEESWSKVLKNKIRFFIDPLLFKKHPRLYKKYIKFPFELFTPLYILFSLLGFLNPIFFIGLPLTAIVELFYRKWSVNIFEFFSFLVLQTIGSFVLIISVLYGCLKFRVSPFRLFLFPR